MALLIMNQSITAQSVALLFLYMQGRCSSTWRMPLLRYVSVREYAACDHLMERKGASIGKKPPVCLWPSWPCRTLSLLDSCSGLDWLCEYVCMRMPSPSPALPLSCLSLALSSLATSTSLQHSPSTTSAVSIRSATATSARVVAANSSSSVQKTGKPSEKSDLRNLEELLARHNKKFKPTHTYEPPAHSVRDVKAVRYVAG
jgi:hypothetical protein